VEHLLDCDVRDLLLPPTNCQQFVVRDAAFVWPHLDGISGVQVGASQVVFQLRRARKQIQKFFTRFDGRKVSLGWRAHAA
jgi:hypothetical protein